MSDSIKPTSTPGTYTWLPEGGTSEARLILDEAELQQRISAIESDEPSRAFGEGVSDEEAAWRLLTIHLDEEYQTKPESHNQIRVTRTGIISSSATTSA